MDTTPNIKTVNTVRFSLADLLLMYDNSRELGYYGLAVIIQQQIDSLTESESESTTHQRWTDKINNDFGGQLV